MRHVNTNQQNKPTNYIVQN